MKLLIYSHFFAPNIGGVETVVSSLARGLSEGPHGEVPFDVTVVTNTLAAGHDDSIYPFRVVRSPSLLRLAGLVYRTDVLHIAGPALLPLLIGWALGKPRVVEHHGYQAICPNGILLKLPQRSLCPGHFQAGEYSECLRCQSAEMPRLKALLQLALMFPRHLLAKKSSSNVAISDHVLRRHQLPSSTRIHHGVYDAIGKLGNAVQPEQAKPFCFAFVGRFVPEKGIFVLLRAIDILKRDGLDFQVQLIGDGPERAQIEAFIAERELSGYVRIRGYLSGAFLEDTLQPVRAVVMPSLWEEAAGLSAIEQMMRGRLVIASAIGGLGEVVGDAGLLCVPGDPVTLAAQMELAVRDSALTSEFGLKARARALQLFSHERMIQDHASLYRGIVARVR